MTDLVVEPGETRTVDIWYPLRSPESCVEISLVDIRASDGIRVSYDFDRDGWVIKQPTTNVDGEQTGWQEVAFAKSWQLEKTND